MAHALERRNRTFTAGSVGKDLRAKKYGTFGNFDVLTIRRGIRLLKVRGEIEGQGSHNLVISSPVRVPHDIAVVTDEDYCEVCGGYREINGRALREVPLGRALARRGGMQQGLR